LEVIIKWSCDIREAGDKRAIKVAEAKKASNIFDGGWYRPFSDAFNFNWVHFDVSITDDDTQVFDLLFMKSTLFWLKEKVMFGQFVQKLVDSMRVFLFVVSGGNEGIIHIDMKPTLCDFLLKDVIHYCLEGSQRVG